MFFGVERGSLEFYGRRGIVGGGWLVYDGEGFGRLGDIVFVFVIGRFIYSFDVVVGIKN